MATVASLIVSLGMNTAGFSSGTKTGLRDLKMLAHGAMALNATMNIASAGISATLSALSKFKEVGEGIDKINDLSNATGFSTEKISGLEYTAKQAGVGIETLNGGLKRMVVNLGKAQSDADPAAQSFEQLGLNAKLLNNIGPDAAFNSIAEAISRIPSPAEKAAAAVEIFGKSGIELINVLNLGKDGLRELHAEAERMRSVLKAEDVKQVAEAFDAMDKSVDSLTGAFRELAILSGPTVRLLSTAFTNQLQHLRKGQVAEFLAENTFGLGGLATAQEQLKRADEDKLYGAGPRISSKQAILDEFDVTKSSLNDLKTLEKEVADGQKKVMDGLKHEQENRNRLFEQALTPLEQYRKKVAEIHTAITKLNNARVLGFIDDGSASAQRGGLLAALNRVHAEERKRRDEKFVGRVSSLKDDLKTPGQTLKQSLEDIRRGFTEKLLTADQARLAQLQARRGFLEAQPERAEFGDRPGALLRGSAEAFSASFGSKPVDKIQAEIKRINERMLEVMKNIDKKTGAEFTIPS
jgi:uncharacterized phage infection (PIP) family protein YhgE